MMVLNHELDPFYSDHPDESLPWFVDELRPLEESGCFVPRWYQAPSDNLEVMPASGYIQYALSIPAGSFIWALSGGQNNANYTVQITDVTLKHRFFSQPVPGSIFRHLEYYSAPLATGLPEPYILPKPYPVISPGIFLCEFWGTPGLTTLIVILTAEVGSPWKGNEGVRI